ncbi:MAG: hypothetical protein PHE84_04525 [bacterium]|nr:hypothetical protein [bacterium]
MMRKLANWFANTSWGREIRTTDHDLSAFAGKPSFRMTLGLILLVISYIIGWPAVALCGMLAARYREPSILIIGGPAVYIFSWIVWWISMLLIGKESMGYGKTLGKWLGSRFIARYGDPVYGSNKESEGPINSPSTNSSERE